MILSAQQRCLGCKLDLSVPEQEASFTKKDCKPVPSLTAMTPMDQRQRKELSLISVVYLTEEKLASEA